jgi:hypothetical protein
MGKYDARKKESNIPIPKAINKRLLIRPIPSCILIPPHIPHDLIHNLRNSNRVRTRTIRRAQPASIGVSDMTLMIWTIQIYSIPATGENDSRPNTAGAVLIREFRRIFSITRRKALPIAQAPVADGGFVCFLRHGVTGDHAEAGFKSSHFVVFGGVGHVVDCHAACLCEPDVCELRHALEGAVFWALEVEGGGPVVAEVFAVGTGCACGALGGVEDAGFHLWGVSVGMGFEWGSDGQ